MRYIHRGLTVFLLALATGLTVCAQTPNAATNYYQHAAKQVERGNLDAAIEDYTRAIEISSRLSPDQRDRAVGSDSFRSARDPIVAIDPLTARAYTNRGIARYRKGDFEGALIDLNLALQLNSGLATTWLGRGVVRKVSGDVKGALADFDRAILIDPKLAEAYNHRADVRLDQGEIEGALADLNHSLELKPRLAETFYQLGYLHLAQHDWDGAIAGFERALQIKPQLAGAYQGLGTVWMDKEDLNRAIVYFNRALELDPRLAFAYMNRGLAFLLQGRDAEAQKDFDQCLAEKPSTRTELERRIALTREFRNAKAAGPPR